jgi:hypothetical protein
MSEQQNDEAKMDRIRKMLDNPTMAISHDEKGHLTALQKRLSHTAGFHSQQTQDNTDSKDLTPNVVIHHKTPLTSPVPKQTEPSLEIKESSLEQRSLFDDEELFEIEKSYDDSLPEFHEVTPLEKENLELEKTVTPNIVHLDETSEELPQWHLVAYEEMSQRDTEALEPEKTLPSNEFHANDTSEELPQWQLIDERVAHPVITEERKPEKKKRSKKKLKFSKPFKGSTVPQKEKEPQIWEEAESAENVESLPQKITFSPWVTKEGKQNEEKKPTNIITPKSQDSKELSYSYGDYSLYRKNIQIGNNETRTVHFFSKDAPEDSEPALLPKGYSVHINKKTGVPYIKKIH